MSHWSQPCPVHLTSALHCINHSCWVVLKFSGLQISARIEQVSCILQDELSCSTLISENTYRTLNITLTVHLQDSTLTENLQDTCITFTVQLQDTYSTFRVHLQYNYITLPVQLQDTYSTLTIHLEYTCITLAEFIHYT